MCVGGGEGGLCEVDRRDTVGVGTAEDTTVGEIVMKNRQRILHWEMGRQRTLLLGGRWAQDTLWGTKGTAMLWRGRPWGGAEGAA